MLTALRVVQGVSAAGSSVLVLAVARDVSDGAALVRLVSRITLVTTTGPLLAPVAGAALLPLVGWRGIFGVLAAFPLAVLVMTVAVVPETHRTAGGDPRRQAARLAAVLRGAGFRTATLLGAMTYAGVYAYVAAAPLLLQGVHGLSPAQFALAFLANSFGLVVGVQAAAALHRRRPSAPVVPAFARLTAVAAAALLPLQHAGAGTPGLLVCLWLFVAGCGGCFAGAAGRALRDQSGQAGTATSLYGFGTFAAAGLIAPVAGAIGLHDAAPLAAVLGATSLTGTAAAVVLAVRDRHDARAARP